MQRIYLIKNPAAWMIDELAVFAKKVPFKVIFIRKPNDFYTKKLEELKGYGVEIHYLPGRLHLSFGKLFFCLKFCLTNVSCFFSRYSFVIAVKSLWWFLKFDDSHFDKPVNIHAQFATQT